MNYTAVAPSSGNFPQSQLSVNVGGTVVFLPEMHTNVSGLSVGF